MSYGPYNKNAQKFFTQYQSLTFEQVHSDWLPQLYKKTGLALDVGAGSGRDALALAERGWDVVAVEPAAELRRLGEAATAHRSIQWVDDSLPDLSEIRKLSYRFDLVLVSAVWMHLPPTYRERAFRILTELLAPSGMLVITLRHGPGDGERQFYEVSKAELDSFARHRAVMPVPLPDMPRADQLKREDVWWETAVYRLPDDGTGALPLLRHIIVNDNKSSTYKLGLLRSLTRIADSLPSLVLRRDEYWVELPLGVVALYWIKLYQPLILRYDLRQAPGSQGYGFAKEPFKALASVSPMDLRVGSGLSAELAPIVLGAIRDAARTITEMPVRYTTWPGTTNQVFESALESFRLRPGSARLDRETLARFGRFRVPTLLWDCFSRYACWIEPAIVNEWVQLMEGYRNEVRYDDSRDRYLNALDWAEQRRDTSLVRGLVADRLAAKQPVHCVWSQRNLARVQYDIDHCFPWSRWNNNDLWNLFPADKDVNQLKSEKLPSAEVMLHSKPRILEWWRSAYVGQEREEQFFIEAEAALPVVTHDHSVETVFEGMMQQRLRLKMNQQLVEWMGVGR